MPNISKITVPKKPNIMSSNNRNFTRAVILRTYATPPPPGYLPDSWGKKYEKGAKCKKKMQNGKGRKGNDQGIENKK
jgi:hypothetical protein